MVALVAVDRDEEARETAYKQARTLERRDPDAARALLAQLDADARAAGAGGNASPSILLAIDDAPGAAADASDHKPYDAIRFRARLLKFYRGAITWTELGRLHYLTAFALAREAAIQSEEEQAEIDRIKDEGADGRDTRSNGHTVDPDEAEAQLAAILPRPRPYPPRG